MFGFGEILKQAKQLQEFVEKEIDQIEVEVEVAAGRIKIRMNGKKIPTAITIDPALLKPEERDQLELLLLSGFQEAARRVEAEVKQRVSSVLPPGLSLPGF